MSDTDNNIVVSVVIPLFNEEESLSPLCVELKNSMDIIGKPFEWIFVDDGSTDGSLEVLLKLKNDYPEIRVIQFQRNEGKSAALAAGFKHVRGDYVVTLDADLQDDPVEIPALIQKLEAGFDLVSGWKKNRKDPLGKRFFSKIFNFITSRVTGARLHDHNCGLKAYKSAVVDSISIYGELHRFIPPLAYAKGYSITEIPVKHHKRKFGKTKYGMWRLFSGFFDLLTVFFLTRFTNSPLHLFGIAGLLFFSVGFLIDLYLTIDKYIFGAGIGNRPLLFLGMLLIIVGFQFFSMGFLGEMLASQNNNDRKYTIKHIYD
jgi:glycosyltransferase involved in cell wall biosynthesis